MTEQSNQNARITRQITALLALSTLVVFLVVFGNGRNAKNAVNNAMISIQKTSTTQESTRPRQHQSGRHYKDTYHCVVHVHGFHQSGTGYLRKVVYDALGGSAIASVHTNTGQPEDEGQHLQSVFPNIRRRTRFPDVCGIRSTRKELPRQLGQLYYCPKLQISMENTNDSALALQQPQAPSQQQHELNATPNHTAIEEQKQRLFQEWSKHWNLTQPILIQKTPTFDVLYLEQMKVCETVHLLVMRHPMVWYHFMTNYWPAFPRDKTKSLQLIRPVVWLDVWATILQQLASGKIQSYAVVQYESLLSNVPVELPDYVKQQCNVDASATSLATNHGPSSAIGSTSEQQGRRRLHLRAGNATEFVKPKPEIVTLMAECQLDSHCRNVTKDLEPILLRYFGYTWNTEQMFVLPSATAGKDNSQQVLFSSQRPPPEALVQDLLRLKDKYTSLGKKNKNRH